MVQQLAIAVLKAYLVACIGFTGIKTLHCSFDLGCRLLDSAAFRSQLLTRHGTVVAIPYNPDISTAESMACDIKAAVEAKTGLPLDSFRS